MSDLISRKMAIDAVAKWFHEVFGIKESDGTATIFKRLRELPSAQPELLEHEAYIRGFEQGRTQGMIDAKEGKK